MISARRADTDGVDRRVGEQFGLVRVGAGAVPVREFHGGVVNDVAYPREFGAVRKLRQRVRVEIRYNAAADYSESEHKYHPFTTILSKPRADVKQNAL